MALTKQLFIDKVEVLRDGFLHVRIAREIFDDGELAGQTYSRYGLAPGDDITNQPPKVKAIANAVWTQAVIDAWRNRT